MLIGSSLGKKPTIFCKNRAMQDSSDYWLSEVRWACSAQAHSPHAHHFCWVEVRSHFFYRWAMRWDRECERILTLILPSKIAIFVKSEICSEIYAAAQWCFLYRHFLSTLTEFFFFTAMIFLTALFWTVLSFRWPKKSIIQGSDVNAYK